MICLVYENIEKWQCSFRKISTHFNKLLFFIIFLLQIPQLNFGRKMPGCSKVIHENQMSLVVAGGQDSTGNKLKSVEIIAVDIENRSTPLTWTVLGTSYILRQ